MRNETANRIAREEILSRVLTSLKPRMNSSAHPVVKQCQGKLPFRLTKLDPNKSKSQNTNIMTLNKTTESYSTITPVIVEDDSVDNSHIDITKDVAEEDKHLVQPAGVGAAIVGTIFFGPILGPLLGFSAAYGVRKNNSAGNLARAVGELTSSVQETADKIEEKNRFREKTTDAINNFCDKGGETSISFKTRQFLVTTWLSLATFTKERQLIERGVEGTGKGLEAIGRAFDRLLGKSPPTPDDDVVFVGREVPVEITAHATELKPVKTH